MQIRCTQKLLKELGIKNTQLADIEQKTETLLGNWCANMFALDRRKTLLFMNERTLLSFTIYGIRKDNNENFPIVFLNGNERVLAMEGFPDNALDKVLAEHATMFFTRTHSHSLRGNTNDLVSLYTHFVLSAGGLKHAELFGVIARIIRMPQRNIGWHHSIDAVHDLMETSR